MSKNSLNSSMNLMGSLEPLNEDFEFLSLFIEEAMNGVDVAKRYSKYYHKLITNPRLRQAFLDVIQLLEADQANALETLPEPARGDLLFLMDGKQKKTDWKFEWKRSIEQLQEIFSPPQLAYRSASTLGGEEEICLLQEEYFANEFRYSVTVDCVLSEAPEAGLLLWISINTYLNNTVVDSRPAIQATLRWGDYEETIRIATDGRLPLPPVPIHAAFDRSLEQIKSALELTIISS